MGELKTAFDVLILAVGKFMLFFRQFWDFLPLVVKALCFFMFGLAVLFGLMKLLF